MSLDTLATAHRIFGEKLSFPSPLESFPYFLNGPMGPQAWASADFFQGRAKFQGGKKICLKNTNKDTIFLKRSLKTHFFNRPRLNVFLAPHPPPDSHDHKSTRKYSMDINSWMTPIPRQMLLLV